MGTLPSDPNSQGLYVERMQSVYTRKPNISSGPILFLSILVRVVFYLLSSSGLPETFVSTAQLLV